VDSRQADDQCRGDHGDGEQKNQTDDYTVSGREQEPRKTKDEQED
jgi:hypothetical protein